MAVITTFELHDDVATGISARRTKGAHRRLGAARNGAHHLHGRVQPAQHLRETNLELRRRAVARPAGGGVADGGDDGGMGVPENHRAPRAHVVDEAPPVGSVEERALRPDDEDGRTADGAERAHGTVHAAGNDAARAVEERARR